MPKKNTFLSDTEITPSGKEKRHLLIVITDPDSDSNQVVVSVTSLKNNPRQDHSCILHPSDHKFIQHDSIIDFKRTRIMSFSEIFNGIQHGFLLQKEDISNELLLRIQESAKISRFIPTDTKALFEFF